MRSIAARCISHERASARLDADDRVRATCVCHLTEPRARRSAASGRPQRAAASMSSRTAQFDKPMSARTRDTLLRGRERLVVAAKAGAQHRGRPLACGHPPAVAAPDGIARVVASSNRGTSASRPVERGERDPGGGRALGDDRLDHGV
jgi:hypothetical protein